MREARTIGLGHHALGRTDNHVQGKLNAIEQKDIENATNVIADTCQLLQLNLKV